MTERDTTMNVMDKRPVTPLTVDQYAASMRMKLKALEGFAFGLSKDEGQRKWLLGQVEDAYRQLKQLEAAYEDDADGETVQQAQ